MCFVPGASGAQQEAEVKPSSMPSTAAPPSIGSAAANLNTLSIAGQRQLQLPSRAAFPSLIMGGVRDLTQRVK